MSVGSAKVAAKPSRWLRRGRGTAYRKVQSLMFLLQRDRSAIVRFLRAELPVTLPLRERLGWIARFVEITNHVRAYHSQAQILEVPTAILELAHRPGLTEV